MGIYGLYAKKNGSTSQELIILAMGKMGKRSVNAYICTTLSLYLSVAWSIWQGLFPIKTSLSVNK